MMPDPTFNFSEANRRIADAQALAAAERLVRGTSDRPDRHGVVSTLASRGPAPHPGVEAVRNRAHVPRRTSPLIAIGPTGRGAHSGSPSGFASSGSRWTGRGARLPSPFVAAPPLRPGDHHPGAARIARLDPHRDALRHVGQGEHRRAELDHDRAHRRPVGPRGVDHVRRPDAPPPRPSPGSAPRPRRPSRRPRSRGTRSSSGWCAARSARRAVKASSAMMPGRPLSMTWPSIPWSRAGRRGDGGRPRTGGPRSASIVPSVSRATLGSRVAVSGAAGAARSGSGSSLSGRVNR